MTKYIPPPNFGYVEEDFTRSGSPQIQNYSFLETLKLKTLIFMATETPSSQFLNFLEDQEIKFIHVGSNIKKNSEFISTMNSGKLSEENVIEALEIILDSSNFPLHVMCNLGRHKTGIVVGCFRKLQKWNLTSILYEYRRYAGSKVRLENEQFIELFDTDLVKIPSKTLKTLYL
eukprot:gene7743-12213_t